jgi:hypothetical protein
MHYSLTASPVCLERTAQRSQSAYGKIILHARGYGKSYRSLTARKGRSLASQGRFLKASWRGQDGNAALALARHGQVGAAVGAVRALRPGPFHLSAADRAAAPRARGWQQLETMLRGRGRG